MSRMQWACCALLVTLVTAVSATAAVQRITAELRIGEVPGAIEVRGNQVSPDLRAIAVPRQVDGQWVVQVHGDAGRRYESIAPDSLTFSPDGKRLAYAAVVTGRETVVSGRKEGPMYDAVTGLTFGADGTRFGYAARTGLRWRMVIDDSEGKVYDGLGDAGLLFSPDGAHTVYAACTAGKWCVVRDGQEGKAYDAVHDVGPSSFSADGKRLAYLARIGERWRAVVDGQEGDAYDAIGFGSLALSADGSTVAYAAGVALADGIPISGNGRQRRSTIERDWHWTPRNVPYEKLPLITFGGNAARWCIVVNGTASESYAGVGAPVISPNGKRLAYAALVDGQWRVICDGVAGKAYDEIGYPPAFSPDNTHLVYAAREGRQWMMVVDGKEGEPFDELGYCYNADYLAFSPDGARLAYKALLDGKWRVVVDGLAGKPYDAVSLPVFSPDGRHVAYIALVGEQHLVVVDGEEGTRHAGILPLYPFSERLKFDGPDRLHYLVQRGSGVYLVDEWVR